MFSKAMGVVAACVLLLAAAAAMFLGPSGEHALIARAKDALRSVARDPASVQFQGMRVVVQPNGVQTVVCGEYNAKNGFGGYTGFKRLYMFKDGDLRLEGNYGQFEAGWRDFCAR